MTGRRESGYVLSMKRVRNHSNHVVSVDQIRPNDVIATSMRTVQRVETLDDMTVLWFSPTRQGTFRSTQRLGIHRPNQENAR